MHGLPLLKGRAQGAMQPVLEIELPAPRHDVGEEVAIEGRVFFQERFQVQCALSGN
jgi:hypothetical protein